ncbi:MAG: alpha/beta fold hydrolase [Planctomycetota bacterium]|nr:MAG: alpha/beta fold hydrolase [Planctomycetota bacterium]
MTPGVSPNARLAPRKPSRVVVGWVIYAVLLAASHGVQWLRAEVPGTSRNATTVEIPLTDTDGVVEGRTQEVAYFRWNVTRAERQTHDPILLLHGSPGSGTNFTRLAPRLADAGYAVFAPDLPGFGDSTKALPSYAIRAHAHAMLELLDALGIDRVHVAGWSQGGGVALWMAELAPDRVASLTLIASVGVQESEGSGSYLFEHIKYGVGYLGLVLGGEAIPHFGLLQEHWFRRSFIRNFWDSDQRPLRDIMSRLTAPTLILHGRDDFLTPIWAATASHELITPSRLIITGDSHFLPVVQAEQTAADMAAFLNARTAGLPMQRDTIDRAPARHATQPHALPRSPARPAGRPVVGAPARRRRAHPCARRTRRRPPRIRRRHGLARRGHRRAQHSPAACRPAPRGCGGAAAAPPGTPSSDPPRWSPGNTRPPSDDSDSCSAPASSPGGATRPRATGQLRRLGITGTLGAACGTALWTALALVLAMTAASIALATLGDGFLAMAAALLAAPLAVRLGIYAATWSGRRRLLATLGRARRREFWPATVLYAPVAIRLLATAARHRGLLTFTCVNPVIGAGGGVVGESKHRIQTGLEGLGEGVMRTALLAPGDPDTRLASLEQAIESGRLPDGYPLVLKPDAGQRGYGVKVVRSPADARDYLTRMTRPVLAQQYHPGPIEVGVLWVREPDPPTGDNSAGRVGRVFSVTAKEFPRLKTDGRHTIEQLIYRHPRFRLQADILLDRMAGRRLEIPERDDTVSLGNIGNHAQGALFRDGMHLMTPELEAWIDRAAAAFRSTEPTEHARPDGDNGLDFGRFDIRARSIEDLAAARDLGIIELNGTTAESTNIYDPDRSVWWTWGVLLRQWQVLYRLGARRRSLGVPPMGLAELRRAWAEFADDRPDLGAAE